MEQRIKTHKDLIVWQKAIDLVVCVYSVTREFPSSELYALTNQIRRCATSIPGNIGKEERKRIYIVPAYIFRLRI